VVCWARDSRTAGRWQLAWHGGVLSSWTDTMERGGQTAMESGWLLLLLLRRVAENGAPPAEGSAWLGEPRKSSFRSSPWLSSSAEF